MNSIFKRFRSIIHHDYSLPIVVSVLLHIVLFICLFISWDNSDVIKISPVLHIKASLVDRLEPKPKVPKLDHHARIKAEKRRKIEAERIKKAKAIAQQKEIARRKEIALQKRQKEAKEKKELERKRKALAQKKRLSEQLKREQKERQNQLETERIAREQEKQQAAQFEKDAEEVNYYQKLLVSRMVMNWTRPASARNNMETLVKVQLSPFGDLLGFTIIKSSGNDAFDQSVIQAIKLGTPILELKHMDRRIFEKYFRQFTFKFSPEDLVK